MNEEEVISIRQAAKLFGISEQAVYKRLNTTFKPYVVEQLNAQGKPLKRLKASILDDAEKLKLNVKDNRTATDKSTVDTKVEQQYNQPQDAAEMASESVLTAVLQEQISFLREQLETKDRQIESLLKSLQAEQVKTAQLTALLPAPKEPEEQPPDDAAIDRETDPAADQRQDQPQRKGFRAWWHDFWTGSGQQ